MSISRFSKWSKAVRVSACAALTVVCWAGFTSLIYGLQKTSASLTGGSASVQSTPAPVSAAAAAPSANEPTPRSGPRHPVLADIERTYREQGLREDDIKESVDQFDERCRRMDAEKCDVWIQRTLENIRAHPPSAAGSK